MWSKMDRNSCSFLTEWTSVLASSLSLVKEAGLEHISTHTHTNKIYHWFEYENGKCIQKIKKLNEILTNHPHFKSHYIYRALCEITC